MIPWGLIGVGGRVVGDADPYEGVRLRVVGDADHYESG